MLPGIWMSVNSNSISVRDSRMASASSALTASMAVNPASSTISTARMRNSISSSTTRTEAGTAGTTAGSIETMVWHFHLEPMDQPAPVAHLWLRTVQLERLGSSDLTGVEEQPDNIRTA